MAFSDFKNIAQVQTQFNILYEEANFVHAQALEPPRHFVTEFEFNRTNIDIFSSEAARTEMVIGPILREVYKNYVDQYSFWVQKSIVYDSILNGTPDYMIATKSALGKTVLKTPLLIIAEAKRSNFEQEWGQCLAELVAAQKINNAPALPVYGIVTDGNLWQFGRLVELNFTKDLQNYTIDHLANIFGALNFLLQTISVANAPTL